MFVIHIVIFLYLLATEDNHQADKQIRFKQSIQTQELFHTETGTGVKKLPNLWYIPHLGEIITV